MHTEERKYNELRKIRLITGYTEMAAGSVLVECGRTRVICTASVEESVPPFLRGKRRGWVTAEYAMLPGSTPNRKPRDGVKKDGRSVEIQRLIGRSLRAACDLTRLGERTITLDCDVIQADGGTRTASITGAFVALCLAVDRLMREDKLVDSPIIRQLAAVSVGVVDKKPVLDLDYALDSRADVDMNLVMTKESDGAMRFVEVQGTGEGATFSREELDQLIALAEAGIARIMQAQREALGEAAQVIGKKPKLVLATSNFGKLKEMRALLSDHFDVLSMREAGFTEEIEETGETFEENALIKAEAISNALRCAALADDSGLEVEALQGRPGIYSARYAGVHGDDEANNQLLLKELQGLDEAQRRARYVCAMALARPGREPFVARGECAGRILEAYHGDGGFGYDPLFYSEDLQMSFGVAPQEEKNAISHRARAIQALLEQLDK